MRSSRSCIIVVGSTGTGKSTLIGLCTGSTVATSGGTDECTMDIQAFQERGNEDGPVWVDSVGFDGTDSTRSDEEAFQYILRFLQEQRISHVVGVIWTVNPDVRMTAKLQEQAKRINMFKEGSVWDNVIIAVKKTRGNARNDGAGALEAAGRYCNKDNIKAVGYGLLEQLDDNERPFWAEQTRENRMRMGIMTRTEAKELIKETIATLPPLFQVVFRDSKCVDCGAESDERLMPLRCHVLKEQVHPAQPEPFHPLSAVLRHAVPQPGLVHVGKIETSEDKSSNKSEAIKDVATGAVVGLATGSVVPVIGPAMGLFGKGSQTIRVVSYYSCCGKAPDAEGCESQYTCCREPVSNPGCQEVYQCCTSLTGSNPGCARRYPCCGGEEGSSGCRQQCSYCKVTWGEFDSEVGCIGRSHHNVIRLEQQ